MVIASYTRGFPPDGSSLGQTKSTIRDNLDGTFDTVTINHYNQNQADPGKHRYIQLPLASIPAGSTAATELLISNKTSTLGGTNNLFFTSYSKTIASQSVQLTRNEIPVVATNGYTWIPGGILIQWGKITNAVKNTTTTVNFNTSNIDFQTNCLNMVGTIAKGTSSPVLTLTIIDKTQFTYYVSTSSSSSFDFFWWALGN